MPNYSNGKIYSIRFIDNPNLIYIGSTTQSLAVRFGEHKKKTQTTTLNDYVQLNCNGDWSKAYIELYENYECDNKEQLNRREGEIIRKHLNDKTYDVINKQIAGRTQKEYFTENKEKIKEINEQYFQKHKDKIYEYQKQYREEHKEKQEKYNQLYWEKNKNEIQNRSRQYYQMNKDKIAEKNKLNKEKKREYNKLYWERKRLNTISPTVSLTTDNINC
jgi:hypothetical protein